ncbi:MAG: hypothetical protein PHV82_18595 [Victivallaceae bacterium]|nr:hypothetical protein [Victivallaceae bacterium]
MNFKNRLAKVWKAFNNWRKRGMWFRLTVLLIIGSVPLMERLITPDHVPLINELVWIACRAIRMGSEPKYTSAYLHYLHAKKSRQLQNQLQTEYNAGHIKLGLNELRLLKQNTRQANYNELFRLAQREKIIPADITLSQSKRAMLDEALRVTDERYGPEWEDVHKQTLFEAPFDFDGIMLRLRYFGYGIASVMPLPVIPVLPWFILCLTLGFWGAQTEKRSRWIGVMTMSVMITLLWIVAANQGKHNCFFWREHWQLRGTSIFFAIWAVIGCILGKRLYKRTVKNGYNVLTFTVLLLLSSVVLLMPVTSFKEPCFNDYCFWLYICPGHYLLFRSFAFVPYFITAGILVLLYTLFFICKKYSQQLQKFKWVTPLKYLMILLLLAKLLHVWYF